MTQLGSPTGDPEAGVASPGLGPRQSVLRGEGDGAEAPSGGRRARKPAAGVPRPAAGRGRQRPGTASRSRFLFKRSTSAPKANFCKIEEIARAPRSAKPPPPSRRGRARAGSGGERPPRLLLWPRGAHPGGAGRRPVTSSPAHRPAGRPRSFDRRLPQAARAWVGGLLHPEERVPLAAGESRILSLPLPVDPPRPPHTVKKSLGCLASGSPSSGFP